MSRSRTFFELLKFSGLGLEMGAAVVIGLLFGVFLDRKLDSYPYLTLIFTLFGLIAAARAILRAVREGLLAGENDEHAGGEDQKS